MAARFAGFTLVEMMVVLAVIAILALMAIPSFQDQIVRDQINNALPLADIANNYISSVLVKDGALNVIFGNRANGIINGKTLTIRPAVVDDAPIVPVAWVCGYAEAPHNMTVKGENRTNIPENFLPFACRARGGQKK
jgi:type IV pilus assembly protein PilA